MNLTESSRARELIEGIILAVNEDTSNVVSTSEWKTVATRFAVVAAIYGVFFVVKRRYCPEKRSVSVGAKLNSGRSRRCERLDTRIKRGRFIHIFYPSRETNCPLTNAAELPVNGSYFGDVWIDDSRRIEFFFRLCLNVVNITTNSLVIRD